MRLGERGPLEQVLRLGWPAADEAGYDEGADLDIGLQASLRTYQTDAVASWWADGSAAGGNGVLVLPCGAGKTVIGLAAMAQSGASTLIVVTSIVAARQWIAELRDKTDLPAEAIGEYSGDRKQIFGPISANTSGTGQTGQATREQRFAAFRDGSLRLLVVSKVANFSIDLPEANVAIQLSGRFGSRQEEAQRLGRILRPKADGGQASFYTVVARETVDQAFAADRQRFLTEQGYAYTTLDADEVVAGA